MEKIENHAGQGGQGGFGCAKNKHLRCPTDKNHILSSANPCPPYVVRSHRRRVPSQDPDSANCPSEEMTTSLTK